MPILNEHGKSYLARENGRELLFRLVAYAVDCMNDPSLEISLITYSLSSILFALRFAGLDISQQRVDRFEISFLIKIGRWKDDSPLAVPLWGA